MNEDGNGKSLEGLAFLRHAWRLEDQSQTETDSYLASMGREGLSRLDGIGAVLAHISRMGSCFWGHSDRNHAIVYLCTRAASNGHAAVRLLRMGYYDESLLLSRSIGEIANLLVLFCTDDVALAEYRESQESWETVRTRFTPVRVRCQLEKLTGQPPPIDYRRYSSLSARSAHANPDTRPQSFNLLEQPSTGMMFQQIGFLVCLNELVRPLAYTCLSAASLLDISSEVKQDIEASAEGLLHKAGRLDLSGLKEMHSLVTVVIDDQGEPG